MNFLANRLRRLDLVPFAALVLLSGCGPSADTAKSSVQSATPAAEKSNVPPTTPVTTDSDKPHVEVLLGRDFYEKTASTLTKGKKAKFEGEISLRGTTGKKVQVQLAHPFEGDGRAVPAEVLTKDFLADRAAAEKKYKREAYPNYGIIVEGIVTELRPKDLSLILAGHDAAAEDKGGKVEASLAGSWIVVSWLTLGIENDAMKGDTVLFKDGKITQKSKKLGREAVMGEYRLVPGQSPAALDLVMLRGNDRSKPIKCIYAIKDRELKLCKPLGSDNGRPKEFVSTEKALTELITLKRTEP